MTKLHGTGRRRTDYLQWTYDMILTLHIMSTELDLSLSDQRSIFNAMFCGYLRCYGFSDGVTESYLAAFAQHSGYSKAERQMWETTRRPPTSSLEAMRRATLAACVREEALRIDSIRRT